MRIDLNPSAMPELDRSQGSGRAAKSAESSISGVPANQDDMASLSTGSDAVAAMRTQLDNVPDVRQQRVEALRQSISQGTYAISPQGIAEGMLSGGVFAR